MKLTHLILLVAFCQLSYAQISNITFYAGSQDGQCFSQIFNHTEANDIAFFCGRLSNGASRVFTSDGTLASSAELFDFEGNNIRNPGFFITLGNLAIFEATHPIYGTTIYRSNGTPSGTFPIYEGYIESITNMFVYGNKVLFKGTRTGGISDLWVTDGTINGTFELTTSNGQFIDFPDAFVEFNGEVYFSAVSSLGRELYKTNGTVSGTLFLVDINPGAGDGFIEGTVLNNKLLLVADNGNTGYELYSTTNGVTISLIKDIKPGPETSFLSFELSHNGYVYIAADYGINGRELWKTDGTSNNTIFFSEVNLGPEGSSFNKCKSVTSNSFVAIAYHPDTGNELYSVDINGNATLIKDINPGPLSSFSLSIEVVNGLIYF